MTLIEIKLFLKIKTRQVFLSILAILIASSCFSQSNMVHIPHGIMVKMGNQQVQLAVGKTGTFRMGLRTTDTPAAIQSVFIDESNIAYAKFSIVSKPPSYGIKTLYGKLMFNTITKTWSLYDADGNKLITNGTFSISSLLQQISYPAEGLLYGSGNKSTKSLIKTGSTSTLGNGTADLPYVWNNKGYSVLGISVDDNIPATWSRASDTSITWKFKGGCADIYLWPAKTLYAAAAGYISLTGKPKIPPKWAFGYLQSRYGWVDRAYIEDALNKFKTQNLPVDAFIYDFEWFTAAHDYFVGKDGKANYSDFNFNPQLFPEPAKQIADYKKQGVKFIGIRKPRLGNALQLKLAREKGWLIRPESDSRDLDFSKASLRKWYAAQNKPLLDAGVDAWWDDEGESYYTCYYWWNKAQFDPMVSARPGYRHFTLNRSFSPGNQRFGYCTWSGDVPSTWHALLETPANLLNYSLSGMYYGSCDIGGFQGNPSKENLVRWFQAGVFLPIMRAHSDVSVMPRFPWLWGTDGEDAIRKALDLRYQLLPYIYSLAHEAYNMGAPIMRPLVMEFPTDSLVNNMTDEWLLGKGVLAAPILNAGGTRNIYLPEDTWYDFNTNKAIQGPVTISVNKSLDEIPVYVRAGTIIPIGPVIQHSGEFTSAPLEIRIYPGKNGAFTMTEDDDTSYNYIKGKVRTTRYYWNDVTKKLSWGVTGTYADKRVFKTIRAVLGKQEIVAMIGKKGSIKF